MAPESNQRSQRVASFQCGDVAASDHLERVFDRIDSRLASIGGHFGEMSRELDELREGLREIKARIDEED